MMYAASCYSGTIQISIHENAAESIVWELSAILSGGGVKRQFKCSLFYVFYFLPQSMGMQKIGWPICFLMIENMI